LRLGALGVVCFLLLFTPEVPKESTRLTENKKRKTQDFSKGKRQKANDRKQTTQNEQRKKNDRKQAENKQKPNDRKQTT